MLRVTPAVFSMLPTIEEKKNDEEECDEQSEGLLGERYYQTPTKPNKSRTQVAMDTSCDSLSPPRYIIPDAPRLPLKPIHSAVLVAIVLLISIFLVTDRWIRLRKPLVDAHTNAIVLYDYIVVGAGPAGIIVATRLAQRLPDAQVLLLEAGTDSQTNVMERLEEEQGQCKPSTGALLFNEFDVPLLWSGVASGKRHHWPIELLGKAVGGSALFNAMVYIRSLVSDWEDVPGWDYSRILNTYEHLEDYKIETVDENSSSANAFRGVGGPLATTPVSTVDAVASLFVQSASEAGYRVVDSFNAAEQSRSNTTGFYEFNIRNGVRDSVAQAFLGRPSAIPPNLRIVTGVTVTRVIRLEGISVGVEYVQGHHLLQFLVQPGGEVILSAGAIMTPQILANSGLNFTYEVQDHPVVTIGFSIDAGVALNAPSIYMLGTEFNDYYEASRELKTGTLTQSQVTNATRRLGPLSTPGFSAGAFLRSPWAPTEAPDLQLTMFPRHMEPHVVLSSKQNRPAMLVTVSLLQPEGRYRVVPSGSNFKFVQLGADEMEKILRDTDKAHVWKRIFDYRLPSIERRKGEQDYLTEMDVQRLAWGIEEVRKIQSQPPLSLQTGPEIYPAGKDLKEYVRSSHLTNSHWAGTTPIGSVVDKRLRIDKSLRVVDAGVLPKIPNGNIHSTVCVVAHIAADLIVQERKARTANVNGPV